MYTAVYKRTKSGYVAWIEEIPGVNTQGKTKKTATENLKDALKEFMLAQRQLGKREYPTSPSVQREPFPIKDAVHA